MAVGIKSWDIVFLNSLHLTEEVPRRYNTADRCMLQCMTNTLSLFDSTAEGWRVKDDIRKGEEQKILRLPREIMAHRDRVLSVVVVR